MQALSEANSRLPVNSEFGIASSLGFDWGLLRQHGGAVSSTLTCETHLEPPLPHLAWPTSHLGQL